VNVEDAWYDPYARVTLTPDSVEVSYDDVLAYIRSTIEAAREAKKRAKESAA
jgi:hypothetical protein